MPFHHIAAPMFTSLNDANRFAQKLVAMYKENYICEQEYRLICIQVLKNFTALKMNKLVRRKPTIKTTPFQPTKSRLCKVSK
jgi:hypothetical protein